jgi:hypothetical protein
MVLELYEKMLRSLVPDNLKRQLEKEKGTITDGIRYILLASIIVDITFLLGLLFQYMLTGSFTVLEEEYGIDAVALTFLFLVFIPVFMVLSILITNALGFAFCHLLGGKGTYELQFYHFAIAESGLLMVTSFFEIVPCLGDLVSFGLSLYFIYPTFLIYKSVHKISDNRAALVALLPLIVGIILILLVFAVVGTAALF